MNQAADRGAASILGVAAMAVVAVAGVLAMWVALLGAAQVRVSQAADLAALAGAEKAWLDRDAACEVASEIATRHQSEVVACQAVGLDVQVQVRARLTGALSGVGQVSATARAGPPD